MENIEGVSLVFLKVKRDLSEDIFRAKGLITRVVLLSSVIPNWHLDEASFPESLWNKVLPGVNKR